MLSESDIEKKVGAPVERRRIVSDILDRGVEYRNGEGECWFYGPMRVTHASAEDTLLVETPDGDEVPVSIPEGDNAEQVRLVDSNLIDVLEGWLGEL